MPAGTPVSGCGNVSTFSNAGSNLLSTATVVMPLSVKTRWNRVAGVRADVQPSGDADDGRARAAHRPREAGARLPLLQIVRECTPSYGIAGFGFVGWGFH